MQKIEVIKTDTNEIEALLKEHYGIKYEIVAGEECDSRTYLLYTIHAEPLPEYDLRKLEEIKSGKHRNFATRILMQQLCIDGHIEAGEYLIDAGW